MTARICCLDEFFSIRFRALLESAEDLLSERVQRFLVAVFKYTLAATTHSEDAFAHMRKFLQACCRPPSMATVAARHVLGEIRRAHERWQKRMKKRGPTTTPTTAHSRPVWAHSLKRRDRHTRRGNCAFMTARRPQVTAANPRAAWQSRVEHRIMIMRLLQNEWRALPWADKKRWTATARQRTRAARWRIDPLEEYIKSCEGGCERDLSSMPWGLGDAEFPVATEFLEAELRDFTRTTQSFTHHHAEDWRTWSDAVVRPPGLVQGTIKLRKACATQCACCLGVLPAAERNYDKILVPLRLVVAPVRVVTHARLLIVHISTAARPAGISAKPRPSQEPRVHR